MHAEKCQEVNKEASCLAKKKASLERELRTLETRKRKNRRVVVSEKKLDELKSRTATFREVVAIVSSFCMHAYC